MLGKHNQPAKVNELNVNDIKLTSPNDGFNTFFSNIGQISNIGSTECHFKDYLDKANSEFTAFKSVSVNHVRLLLRELSGSKATGLDKISSKIINIAAPLISDSLTYIFNQAIKRTANETCQEIIDQFLSCVPLVKLWSASYILNFMNI